ncbi:MAG: hypothetical protein KGS72_24600 [Cyanobacteria bacterium REEB67]|nr:hypothetical protein [Cyanobacteria bacterium REEB67]
MEEATTLEMRKGRRTQILGAPQENFADIIDLVRSAWRANAPLCVMILFSLFTLGLSLSGMAFDHRQINGELAWIKPFKFSLSIASYGASLLVLQRFLTSGKRFFHLTTVAALAGAILELMAIITQVLRGTTSHFNAATPIDAALWFMVKISIMPVSLAVIVLFVLLMRQQGLPRIIGLSLRLGTFLTIVGLIPAMIMILPEPAQQYITALEVNGHTIGFTTGGPGLPFLGWSTIAGDLRAAHFIGLHALQVVPVVGWLVSRHLSTLALKRQMQLIWNVSLFYFAWIMLLTWQALRAESIAHPSASTIIAYAVLITVSLISAFLTLLPRLAGDREMA